DPADARVSVATFDAYDRKTRAGSAVQDASLSLNGGTSGILVLQDHGLAVGDRLWITSSPEPLLQDVVVYVTQLTDRNTVFIGVPAGLAIGQHAVAVALAVSESQYDHAG